MNLCPVLVLRGGFRGEAVLRRRVAIEDRIEAAAARSVRLPVPVLSGPHAVREIVVALRVLLPVDVLQEALDAHNDVVEVLVGDTVPSLLEPGERAHSESTVRVRWACPPPMRIGPCGHSRGSINSTTTYNCHLKFFT